MKKILFVNCNGEKCGVYQYGYNFYQAIAKIGKFNSDYIDCATKEDLVDKIRQFSPDLIIYNFHPPLLPFITKEFINQIYGPTHVCLAHELSKKEMGEIDGSFFDFYIFADPSLKSTNSRVFKIGRILPNYQNNYPIPVTPVIGSYGFGSQIKGYDVLIDLVQEEFNEAVININIPSNSFFDPEGHFATQLSAELHKKIKKSGIQLNITHEFFSEQQLLDFLAKNSINVFMYDPSKIIHGISSAVDFALAVHRPIAVTKSSLFKHLFDVRPSIVVNYNRSFFSKFWDWIRGSHIVYSSLKEIIKNGVDPLENIYATWTIKNFQTDFVRIIEGISNQKSQKPHRKYNRILDDTARQEYQDVIQLLFEKCPEMMARKIPRANIQQAFILDAVRSLAKPGASILSVGSFEDTACETLIKLGYQVTAIDPAINYDLNSFVQQARGATYDVIFSTSVIEHVEDDRLFIQQIEELLSKEGKAILTCDFKDDWKSEDGIFDGSYRFYTQEYLHNVLLKRLKSSRLLDEPQWSCPNPDFEYGGQKYTFATLAFQKL